MEANVKRYYKKQTIWGLWLSDAQTADVRALAGPQYELKTWPRGDMPDFSVPGAPPAPCLICFTLESCRRFNELPAEQTAFLELAPKALLLDADAGLAELEEALEYGVSDIIRAPLTKKRFASCLRKAAEAAALQRDIQNMAHEVFIEREMLERKNEALSFLVNFMTQINDTFNETELLGKAFTCLQQLFPVMTMHAALFSRDDDGHLDIDLFMAAPKGSAAYGEWQAYLLETAGNADDARKISPAARHLPLPRTAAVTARPRDGHIMILPIHLGENANFSLVLLTPMERNLSRDQSMALDSALSHMALSLKNARRYRQMCHFADRDGLTGAYNRRHFEHTLASEVARHKRYAEDLSMLILDIDHFKHVNDTWGHLKGDEVLRTVSDVIMSTIRQTDYCVRYGGEEFVVLLLHTSSDNAAWLAERLRSRIESLVFTAGNETFSISVSTGVASMSAGETKDGLTLTSEADKALYRAKDEGRNRVIVHTQPKHLIAAK